MECQCHCNLAVNLIDCSHATDRFDLPFTCLRSGVVGKLRISNYGLRRRIIDQVIALESRVIFKTKCSPTLIYNLFFARTITANNNESRFLYPTRY